MNRSNKTRKQEKKKTTMIISRVASKYIQNMDETKDSNENIFEICENNTNNI